MTLAKLSFNTNRVLVTPWRAAYYAGQQAEEIALVALLDPAVLKSLPPPLQVQNTPDEGRKWIAARLDESVILAVLDRENRALIGAVILAEFATSPDITDVHLGYLLTQNHWGKGLASEIISGLVGHLATERRGIRLLGGVEKTNSASARVLVKSGFAINPALSNDDTDMFTLSI